MMQSQSPQPGRPAQPTAEQVRRYAGLVSAVRDSGCIFAVEGAGTDEFGGKARELDWRIRSVDVQKGAVELSRPGKTPGDRSVSVAEFSDWQARWLQEERAAAVESADLMKYEWRRGVVEIGRDQDGDFIWEGGWGIVAVDPAAGKVIISPPWGAGGQKTRTVDADLFVGWQMCRETRTKNAMRVVEFVGGAGKGAGRTGVFALENRIGTARSLDGSWSCARVDEDAGTARVQKIDAGGVRTTSVPLVKLARWQLAWEREHGHQADALKGMLEEPESYWIPDSVRALADERLKDLRGGAGGLPGPMNV